MLQSHKLILLYSPSWTFYFHSLPLTIFNLLSPFSFLPCHFLFKTSYPSRCPNCHFLTLSLSRLSKEKYLYQYTHVPLSLFLSSHLSQTSVTLFISTLFLVPTTYSLVLLLSCPSCYLHRCHFSFRKYMYQFIISKSFILIYCPEQVSLWLSHKIK